MKVAICILVLMLSNFAFAEEAQLGLILGSTSGLSGKYVFDGDEAIDGALAYASDGKYGISIHADYLNNKARQFTLRQLNPLNMYYGVGLRIMNIRTGTDSGKSRLGLRAPIGLSLKTVKPDLEIFGELAAVLDVTPSTDVTIEVGIGARVRF